MENQLDKEITKMAPKCQFEYRCLKDGPACFCKVKNFIATGAGDYLFELFSFVNCSYMTSFGRDFYCSCPARKKFYLTHFK